MTPKPPNFAQTPRTGDHEGPGVRDNAAPDEDGAADPNTPTDALSEILQAIHLRGGSVDQQTSADRPAADFPMGARTVHLVADGSLHLVTIDGAARCQLDAGDMVLLPRGDAHRLHGQVAASWVTGRFHVDDAVAEPLLAALP